MRILPTILFASFAGLALSYPLADTDIWWHLSAGREMVRVGHVLRSDPFCASSTGTPWIDLHWGFQLAAWRLWSWLGDTGLVSARIVLAIGALGIAFARRWSAAAALAGCLCLWVSRSFVDVRPVLVTLVLLAVLQRLLESDPSSRKPRTWIFGALAQVGMVNTQGLFVLGPLFALGFTAGDLLEGRREAALRRGAMACVLLAASLANPWGWQAFDLAGKLAGRILPGSGNLFSSEIPENAPLWRWIGEEPTRIVPLLWLGVALWIGWRRGEGSFARGVLLAATTLLSILAVRNLPLLCLEIAFCLGFPSSAPIARAWTGSTAAIAAAFAILAVQQRRWDAPGSRVAPLRLPGDEAISLLENSREPVFHEIRAGGWLTWKTRRPGACWCDTRLVLHDAPFVARYLELADHPDSFPSFAARGRFGWVLLPVLEFPRFQPLVAWLLRSPDWSIAQCDGAWILFQRRSPSRTGEATPDPAAIERSIARRFGSNPRLLSRVREGWREVWEAGRGGEVPAPSPLGIPR